MKKIDWSKPAETRLGRKIRVLCTDGPDLNWPVIGIIDGQNWTTSWSVDGRALQRHGDDCAVNIPETHEIWVNVYRRDGRFNGVAHATRDQAELNTNGSRIACLHREFEEGEGLP